MFVKKTDIYSFVDDIIFQNLVQTCRLHRIVKSMILRLL